MYLITHNIELPFTGSNQIRFKESRLIFLSSLRAPLAEYSINFKYTIYNRKRQIDSIITQKLDQLEK